MWGDERGPLISLSSLDLLLHVCLSERCKELLGYSRPGMMLRQSPRARFWSSHPPTPARLGQSTSRRPPTSPHSFSLKMSKTCGYQSERRGPRVPSQNFQWLPVDELGRGRGEPHDPERRGSGQGGAGVWSRGEYWARRRRLQSEPALHPNQRCGGCAARPSIFHTKGRPSAPVPSKPCAAAHP